MPGRRSTTAEPGTPLEETGPTAAPTTPPPAPAPEPEQPTQQDQDAHDAALAHEQDVDQETEERIRRLVDEAVEGIRPPSPLSFLGMRMGGIAPSSAAARGGDYPLTVHEAITEVTGRVDAISKDRTASQGGSYKYRGIDDVFSALHPLLADVGLVILPGRVRQAVWETRATSSGGTLNVARLLVRYTLVGPDGSRLTGEAWGEGGDSGDKATQKAHSQSYKSFMLQTFSIPTEESQRDEPDATNPPASPFTVEQQDRAGVAYDAALAADTLEDLVGIRRRAEHLLDVPVRMANGSLHPLRLLFDSRRLAIEGAQ